MSLTNPNSGGLEMAGGVPLCTLTPDIMHGMLAKLGHEVGEGDSSEGDDWVPLPAIEIDVTPYMLHGHKIYFYG